MNTHTPNIFGWLDVRKLIMHGFFGDLTLNSKVPFVIDYVSDISPSESKGEKWVDFEELEEKPFSSLRLENFFEKTSKQIHKQLTCKIWRVGTYRYARLFRSTKCQSILHYRFHPKFREYYRTMTSNHRKIFQIIHFSCKRFLTVSFQLLSS